MSKKWIKKSSTSQSIDIFILNSSSTVGAGLTGLVFNTASLTCAQRVGNAAAAAITLVTQTATNAYSSAGFAEVSSALMPGVYRFDIPNTQLTTAGILILYFKGATNMAPVVVEIEVTEIDINDVVRAGLTAIPNIAQGITGAISTGNATGQVTVASGGITTGSFTAGAIDAAAIATDAIGSDEIAATATAKIADAILARKLDSTGNETSSSTIDERTVRHALRYLRNKVSISGSTMIVTLEDDITSAWTAALTTSPGVDPVTSIDPV